MKSNKNVFSSGFAFLGMLSQQFILQLSTLVVAMLLLLAGDVERNPGPITGKKLNFVYILSERKQIPLNDVHVCYVRDA